MTVSHRRWRSEKNICFKMEIWGKCLRNSIKLNKFGGCYLNTKIMDANKRRCPPGAGIKCGRPLYTVYPALRTYLDL